MEKIIEIKVNEAIYLQAENVAKDANSTVAEMCSEYVSTLAKANNSSRRPNSINSKKELYAALAEGKKAIDEGRYITHEEFIEKWTQKLGR